MIRIVVTQGHIACGIRSSTASCPVATAASQALGRKVLVDGVNMEIDGALYVLPGNVLEFIYKYDSGNDVEPITFEVDL